MATWYDWVCSFMWEITTPTDLKEFFDDEDSIILGNKVKPESKDKQGETQKENVSF